jgi:hypothetical protein
LVYYGGSGGPETNGPYIACWRFEDGSEENQFHIKAYPGHSPVLDAQYGGMGIYIWQSSWWEIDGLEIKNSADRGILIAGVSNIKIHNCYIHEVSGESGYNNAGIHINGCNNVEIYDSTFDDNLAAGNSCNITHFQGTNITIHDCDFSHPVSGPCVKYKHASNVTDAYFHVYNNTFSDCMDFSFGASTYNTHFHNNIIVGGGGWAIISWDFGGYTHQTNLTFEYNTVYDAPAFRLDVFDTYTDPENIKINNNIFYDTATSGWGIVAIGHYNTDYLLNLIEPELSFGDNCYFNPNIPVKFDFGAAWNHLPDYSEGGQYNLAGWQSEYGWDIDSVEDDPCFVDAPNGNFRLLPCSPCAAMGAHAGDFDDNSIIDWGDVYEISQQWLNTGDCIEVDLNNDNIVNFPDFAEFAKIWVISQTYDPNYLLTVNSGSGGGLYKKGTVVSISADVVGGMIFDEWTGDISGIGNIYAADTTLTMPASNVTITATYVPIPTYLLTVNNGSGGGPYEEGEVVAISANAAPPGEEFSHWTGDTTVVANIFQASTTVTMPAQAVTVTATYKDIGTVFVTEEFGDAADTNYPGTIEDTYTNAGDPDGTRSTATQLKTYIWPADTVANTTIIKWDLSVLPTDTVIVEATLHLYLNGTGGDAAYNMGVHKIINVNPVISALTWNTYDGTNSWTGGGNGGQSDIAAAEDIPAVNNTINEYKTWSVTNMVADWVATPANNYGMLVNADADATVDSHRYFASTEDANTSIRPKLVVTYISAE